MEFMEEMEAKLMELHYAFEAVYPRILKIDDPTLFLSFVGTLIDQWAVDHDLSDLQVEEMLRNLLEVRGSVVKKCGAMKKSNEH